MITTSMFKSITTAMALMAMAASLAPVPASAAPRRGEGQWNSTDTNVRHYNGNRGRHYGHRYHRNRGLRIGIPTVRIYSSEYSGCGYSYRKWQITGSRYWRARYYDCRNG